VALGRLQPNVEKCRLEIENFSGLSAHAVKQDFYAKLFVLNLTAVLSWVAQAIADRLYCDRQHTYRVNFAQALSNGTRSQARSSSHAPGK